MQCLSCSFENPEGTRFCIECGTPLRKRCTSCGAENLPQAKFCGECGTSLTTQPPASQPQPLAPTPQAPLSYTPRHLAEKILTSRSALEGERRQVTVLFADLAGFTALAERLDPEVVHEVIDRCFELVTAEVHRFEGTVNQYTGDGVMALFGAPIAHEDGPRRAVHAALGIQRSIRDFSRELQARHGFGLQMRIGLNTGQVVVGKIGDDLRMDYTAVGDTTNLAARLQQWARPGSVVISEAAHRLVSGFFETLDLGEVEVRGHAPVRALQAACLASRAMVRSVAWGQIVEMTPDAEEALRLSQEVGDPKLLAGTLTTLGLLLQWRADFNRALAHLHEGVELAEHAHVGFFFGAAAFVFGHAYLARGEYEESLRWYYRLDDYGSAAGDKFFIARAPNCIGGVHLELFDLDEAIRINLEGDEVARKLWPWPEPRGHSLLKVGLAHLWRGEHGLAEEFFRRAWALLEKDIWGRWRWHIPLLRARGELALAQERHEEAWSYAAQSLEMATQTDSRKHIARAQWLQGEILAAGGRLEEGVQKLADSVRLAESIQTPREIWIGKASLGKVLARMGKDKEAEAQLLQAAQTIEAIAQKLQTPGLRQSFLGAEPVLEVYRILGRRPPQATF